jgi:hypothetical protein
LTNWHTAPTHQSGIDLENVRGCPITSKLHFTTTIYCDSKLKLIHISKNEEESA